MFFQVVTLMVLVQKLRASDTEENPNSREHHLEMYERGQYLSSKCLKNSGVDAYVDFVNAKYALNSCIEAQFPIIWDNTLEVDDIKMICSEGSENAHNCIKSVLDKMGVCLTHEEQYLPIFFMDWFDNSVKFICSKNGSILKGLIDTIQYSRNGTHFVHAWRIIENCFLKEFPRNAFEVSDEVIQQREFCGYVYGTRICIVKELSEGSELPIFVNKLLVTITDLATKSCINGFQEM